MINSVYERLADAGIVLPPAPVPSARYLPWRLHAGTLYLAGVTSEAGGGSIAADDISEARKAAALCALRQLAATEAALGTLVHVAAVVRLTGYVACEPSFHRMPEVIDAASELFVLAFGVAGHHARSAVGVSALPGGATVELEAILAVAPTSGV